MNIPALYRKVDGYTLIETVVALALFTTILIPLGVTIGNFIIDDNVHQTRKAFELAQSAMSEIRERTDFTNQTQKNGDGFIVTKKIDKNGDLSVVQILVTTEKNPQKTLIMLTKTFAAYE